MGMSAYRDRTDLYQVLARVWLKNRCVSTVSVGAEADGAGPYLDGLSLAIVAGLCLGGRAALGGSGDPGADARDWIDSHLVQPLVVEELAHRLGVSGGHLHRCFRRCSGQSILAYQLTRRLEAAEPLLREGRPVAEVASAVGFRDPGYFSRQFRRLRGLAPSQLQLTATGGR